MFESLLIGLSPRLSAWIVGVLPEFSTALTTAGLVRGIPYLAIGPPRDGTVPVGAKAMLSNGQGDREASNTARIGFPRVCAPGLATAVGILETVFVHVRWCC